MAPSNLCNCTKKVRQLTAKCKIYLFLLLLLRSALAQLDNPTYFRSSTCEGSEYANGSSLERNLKLVLNSLIENVGETGYNISWYGQNGDTVYGLSQCRGDLNASTCRACVSYAKKALGERCQGYSFGSIRLNGCFLRYATDNFYSKLLFTTLTVVECESIQDRTDVKSRGLDRSIVSLLTHLVENSVSSNVSFSTVSGHGIYGLAQCWRDLGRDDCRKCLNSSYQYFLDCPRASGEGQGFNQNCLIRYERYKFYGDAGLLPSTTWQATGGERGPKLPLMLGLSFGAVIIVLLLLGLAVMWKRKVSHPRSLGYHRPSTELSTIVISASKLNYKYEILETATNNFSPGNKIGQGSFGSVYKGVLPDGTEIAVRSLFSNREQSWVSELFNEVNLISHVQHKNLVKLIGCSMDGPDRLLFYEYIPNKSLHHFLFDGNLGKMLDWQMRLEIILGTASGLAYLHQGSDTPIIHGDIKASNILLDQHFKPKISDFGLVRYFVRDQTHFSTTIVESRNYMAPECLEHGHLTEQVDIYAFGVLVLEIISGRKNTIPMHADDMPSLLTMVWNHYLLGTISNIIDPNIEGNCQEDVLQVVQVALLCTQGSATMRPSMSKVIMFLTSKEPNLPAVTQPPL